MRKIFKTIKKKIFAAALALIMLISFGAFPAMAEVDVNAVFPVDSDYWTYWPGAEAITGTTACLMDANTGTILYSKGLDAQEYPASITKVMTALIVVENCQLEDQVVMTETGLADAFAGSSNSHPALGETFSVYECLEMLLIKSANDIATQLAEHTAGSVAAFADMMNERASQLGCRNTHFANASGLEDPNHYTSARDMALIMQAAIQNETIRTIMAMPECVIPATAYSDERYYSTHLLLTQADSGFYYEGCMGGKTGYTDISRSTLVCYAQRNDMTLIGVVMGAPETESNARDMITLFDYGFNNFYHTDVITQAECIYGSSVTLPYGIDASAITLSPEQNGENVNITYYIEDHMIGSCAMTLENYNAYQLATGQITQNEYNSLANEEKTQGSSTSSDPQDLDLFNNGSSDEAKKGSSPIVYVIIIILGIAILCGVFFIANNDRKKRRKRRKTHR